MLVSFFYFFRIETLKQQIDIKLIMRNSCNQTLQYQFEDLAGLFLKDSLTDALVIINDRIFPMRKNLLKKCGYFDKRIHAQNKFYIKQFKLNTEAFEKVMGHLYGIKICLKKSQEIIKILEVAEVLQYQRLKQDLLYQLQKNFEQYSFFLLYKIAQRYNVKWLEQKCEEDLLILQFEQMNFNRYDFFQLEIESFTKIIKKHEVYKLKKYIKGLSKESVTQIIQEYFIKNTYKIDLNQVLMITQEDIKMVESFQLNRQYQIGQKRKGLIRKRSRTWGVCESQKQETNIPVRTALKIKRMPSGVSVEKQEISKNSGMVQRQGIQKYNFSKQNKLQQFGKECATPSTRQDQTDYKYQSFDLINNQINDKFMSSSNLLKTIPETQQAQQIKL